MIPSSGSVIVRNNNGITIGSIDNNVIASNNLGVVSENNVPGEDYIIRMTTSLGKRDAVTTCQVPTSNVGIYNDNPAKF